MADKEQRDFGIDLAESLLRDADGNVVDVNDETALTQLTQEYRLDSLIESDQSGSESEVPLYGTVVTSANEQSIVAGFEGVATGIRSVVMSDNRDQIPHLLQVADPVTAETYKLLCLITGVNAMCLITGVNANVSMTMNSFAHVFWLGNDNV